MLKTEIRNIEQQSKGILVSSAPLSGYELVRKRMVEHQRDSERINMLEQEITEIKNILQQILNKVT